MRKRTAIGVAATTTLASGTAVVVLAANGVLPILGFGGGIPIERASSSSPDPVPSTVVVTRYVDDYVTVPGADPAPQVGESPPADLPAGDTVSATGTNVIGWLGGAGPVPSIDGSAGAPQPSPAAGGASNVAELPPANLPGAPPTTAAPTTAPPIAPTTTAPSSAPTTTWPRGTEISRSWHGPIPPLPPGCVKPHLEDNGVWNCEH